MAAEHKLAEADNEEWTIEIKKQEAYKVTSGRASYDN